MNLLFVVTLSAIISTSSSQQLPWWLEVDSFTFPHIFSSGLSNDTFISSLEQSSAEYALIEFFAPWCPHCQHFAPEFEQLAGIIRKSGTGSSQPRILAASVDCVRYGDMCRSWGVTGYPTMLWGKTSDWLASDGKDKVVTVTVMERTAPAIIDWIKENAALTLDTSKVSRDEVGLQLHNILAKRATIHSLGPTPQAKVDMWDVQLATALWIRNIVQNMPLREEPQQIFANFLALLARRLPKDAHGGQCRSSLQDLHQRVLLNVSIPADQLEDEWKLCGTNWNTYRHGWRSCRGTWPGKRGYTCGIWNLLHVLAAGTDDSSSLRDAETVRGMIWNFFECDDCRRHFFQIPIQRSDMRSRHSTQIWWWNTHNIVNNRVKRVEEELKDGDPAVPKIQWPTEAQCPDCRRLVALQSNSSAGLMSNSSVGHGPKRLRKAFLHRSASQSGDMTPISLELAHYSIELPRRRPRIGEPPLPTPRNEPVPEIISVEEAVSRGGWDLHEVIAFHNRFYR
mmetsp:Transcript_45138/g.98117  ORF Transcript_45138/g.98117 Transcript_45138/m.98117 type:complete len:509 (+) Transcript_45138:80-1606(+)